MAETSSSSALLDAATALQAAIKTCDAAGNDAAGDATVDLGACLRNPRLRRVDLSGNGLDPQQRARLGALFSSVDASGETFVLRRI